MPSLVRSDHYEQVSLENCERGRIVYVLGLLYNGFVSVHISRVQVVTPMI